MSHFLKNYIAGKSQGFNQALFDIKNSGSLYDTVTREIDGRRIRIGDRWYYDFASCNYLGFDLREEIIESIPPALKKWGVHPSWARLASSPEPYEVLEEKLARLVGAESTLVFPTLSLTHISVIPALTGPDSVIFIDRHTHKTVHDGCRIARDQGAKLVSFAHQDWAQLEELLIQNQEAARKMICIDGVFSVSGQKADLNALVALAKKYDALIYLDDAHGFGILGEKGKPDLSSYGMKGNGLVRHFGVDSEHILYTAGLSKAYSSMAAFVACPKSVKEFLKCTATTYIYAGPIPVASLASTIAGLQLNEQEGDLLRAKIYRYSKQIGMALREIGYETDENDFFPIQSAYIGSAENVVRAGKFLAENGIYVTLQAYPVVPKDRGVIRMTVTAANTDEQVAYLIDVLARLKKILIPSEERKIFCDASMGR